MFRCLPLTLALLAATGLGAPGARAQEAISTAAGDPAGGAPPVLESDPARLRNHIEGAEDIVRSVGPCGGVAGPDGNPDRRPHGEVHAGVGTQGYRQIGGVVCLPVGDHASATIAVDSTRFRGWGPP